MAADPGKEIEELRHALALEKARTAGLRAQVAAVSELVRRHAPELAAETGETLRGSSLRKSAWRLVYDRAFDATARKLGIERPEEWRD